MKLQDKKKIADEADMIINGNAFTKKEDKVFVVHLESFPLQGISSEEILSFREIRNKAIIKQLFSFHLTLP